MGVGSDAGGALKDVDDEHEHQVLGRDTVGTAVRTESVQPHAAERRSPREEKWGTLAGEVCSSVPGHLPNTRRAPSSLLSGAGKETDFLRKV